MVSTPSGAMSTWPKNRSPRRGDSSGVAADFWKTTSGSQAPGAAERGGTGGGAGEGGAAAQQAAAGEGDVGGGHDGTLAAAGVRAVTVG